MLLSIPSKIMAIVILNRIREKNDQKLKRSKQDLGRIVLVRT
jgi:hypothetical protein